jgi:hypothetical protein
MSDQIYAACDQYEIHELEILCEKSHEEKAGTFKPLKSYGSKEHERVGTSAQASAYLISGRSASRRDLLGGEGATTAAAWKILRLLCFCAGANRKQIAGSITEQVAGSDRFSERKQNGAKQKRRRRDE